MSTRTEVADIYSTESLVRPENRTDAANAKRFVRRFGRDVRWCEPWRTWLRYDGKRWAQDTTLYVEALAKQCVDALWDSFTEVMRDVDHTTRSAIQKYITGSNSARGIRDALTVAKSDLAITVEQLDRDPWLFNCANGTLDLKSNKLRAHDRRDFITKVCDVPYSDDAQCPRWRAFVREIFDGDTELVSYVQRLVGYTLTGCQREHLLPICHGNGCNGKSIFLNTLMEVIGEAYAMKADRSLLMASRTDQHPTNIASLYGKRLAAAIETESGRRLNESLVKELTGGDVLTARRMREDFWSFKPTHTIWLATNHRPVIRGDDNGIWRRLRLIPFNVNFLGREDRQLAETLRGEAAGILAWATFGAYSYLASGLNDPAAVLAATKDYRDEQDTLGQFIAERCVTSTTATVRATELYHAYTNWCSTTGEQPQKQRAFGTAMTERGFERQKIGTVSYSGIQLVESRFHGQTDDLDELSG
ncbi:MAG: hypothetical protein JNM18_18090 [Planctomycetaceae bacterium]|nr:hypothetical protein [Planctomycetaceae bacterium]